MSEFYNKNGKPINITLWGKLFKDADYKIVRATTTDDVTVSTVWLGVNHRFGEGQPLIFETMIFGGNNDGYQERYSTLGEARAGHERIVKEFLKGE